MALSNILNVISPLPLSLRIFSLPISQLNASAPPKQFLLSTKSKMLALCYIVFQTLVYTV